MKFSRTFEFCFVIGMHRSGTSATAGLLEGMGLSVGRNVMPATPSNPLGHYENNAIVCFHDRILAALGSHWKDPRPLASRLLAQAPARFTAWREELVAILEAEFAPEGRPVIKDPRLCRLLPIWEPMISSSQRPIVLVIRHPAAVAASLTARDNLAAPKALALWLAYNLEMERETRAFQREFVFYPEILRDPLPVCRHLQRRLGLEECDLDLLIRERLRSELCHQGQSWPDAPPKLHAWCAEAFELLQQSAADTQALDALYEEYSRGEGCAANSSRTDGSPVDAAESA